MVSALGRFKQAAIRRGPYIFFGDHICGHIVSEIQKNNLKANARVRLRVTATSNYTIFFVGTTYLSFVDALLRRQHSLRPF
jgi:hypothetical protein